MTRLYPLYVRRSDGQQQVALKGRREENAPTREQLDRKPDAQGICDYYREIHDDEVKHMDWRRKLGGMLMREIGGSDNQDKACILDALPENYRLYEHIKSKITETDGRPTKSTKNHAGGGHDRQDAYLYGHPLGRKKRYRSPADFFPHMLWLVTDEKGDPDNCSCKICSPEEFQVPEKPAAKSSQVKKEEPVSRPVSQGKPAVVQGTSFTAPTSAQSPVVKPSASPVPNRPSTSFTPLPPPRSGEQQLDAKYNKYIYRPGEVVWFQRGQAWGLGVVTRRYPSKGPQQQELRSYTVQPLSHPFQHPRAESVTEDLLRPWLAWSAPDYSHPGLQNKPVTFDTLDWQGLVNGKYGQGVAEVDASILAAKQADSSFSLFDFISSTAKGTPQEQRRWNGMFVGAEKIWVGEPIRLYAGTGSEVLVVTDIVEGLSSSGRGQQLKPSVNVMGDLYTMTALQPGQQGIPNDRHLPVRMRDEIQWRNNVTIPKASIMSYWKLLKPQTAVDVGDIKGRWYETGILLPILRADLFGDAVKSGIITDVGVFMNGRGHGTPDSKGSIVRKPERMDALGRSIPKETRFLDGQDPPPPEELPLHHTIPETSQDQMMHDTAPIEDFVNLDGMDQDPLPGFGQNYDSQGDGRGFYG